MQLKGLQIVTAAATPLITTADAKTFLRVDGSAEDDLIAFFVESVTVDIENYLRRALITQTLKLTMDRFDSYGVDEQDVYGPGVHDAPLSSIFRSDFIYLPRVPIQSITHIKTYDKDNTLSTFDSASYALDTQNGRVFLNEGYVWPTELRDKNAIEITYVAGYGAAAANVPAPIRRAAYNQLRKVYFERGECELTESTKSELSGYKIEDYLGFS